MLSRYLLLALVLLHLCTGTAAFLFWGRRRRSCSTTRCQWKWGPCSRNCGGGLRAATLTRAKGACGTCDMPTTKESCNIQCCPRNCYWYSWGSWGTCSRTCGTGTQSRSRRQSSASCGGSSCSGSSRQTQSCNAHCCPVHCSWGSWSSWGVCSSECGGGTRSRSRTHAVASYCGGRSCPGLSSQRESCNNHCCPVHCSWAAWGDWSSCSKSCGGGSQARSRGYSTNPSCGGNACAGLPSESRQCNVQCCPRHCSWASWLNWSGCSASCGGGHQKRVRIHAVKVACGGQKCLGINEDTRKCNNHCCPVNCTWDKWASWGVCSTTCGSGRQTRSRGTKLLQSCGGLGCAGTKLESRVCNSHCCPVDCAWGSWSDWRSCSVSCGGGFQNRIRGEDVPRFCGGSTCEGNSSQSRPCNQQCCPVSCKWSTWLDWNSCSVTCGGGRQQRSRSISRPSSCFGEKCVGLSTEFQVCNAQCCPVNCLWNDWTQWGDCSKSCEKGSQQRTRTIAIESQCNGKKCLGGEYHDRFCNEVCCPVHCKWTDWSAWTLCTKSCGNGSQIRRREVLLRRACGGQECAGDNVEHKRCNEQCCPVDCSMSSWSEWSNCSHSCGAKGIKTRSRSVSQPSNCGGAPCSNRFSEEESCNRICFNRGEVISEKCHCAEGWQGGCCEEDVDECFISSGESGMEASTGESNGNTVCSDQSTCTNTDGSFLCTCNTGFIGDGFNCSDLNECEWMEEGSGYSGESSGFEISSCHVNATCFNLFGGYFCGCNDGYKGSGFECNDINECNDGLHDCDSVTSQCVNFNGSHTCVCKKGFSGDGRSCTDIDECNHWFHKCDRTENSECSNTPGSYFCSCKDGYIERDSQCYDIDECETGKHDCTSRYQKCTNTNGGYKCDCREPTIMTNGECEEKVPRIVQLDNPNTWIATLKNPKLIAVIVATGILLLLMAVLIIKIISRNSKGSDRISNSQDDTRPIHEALYDMEEDEL